MACAPWEDLNSGRTRESWLALGTGDRAATDAPAGQLGYVAAAALPDALPRAMDRDGGGRDHQPRCHRGDSAHDKGRDRRTRAASGPARPLAARHRGDGCRDLRGGAVVHPALAGVPRHDGRRGRYPQRPLRPPADPADVVSRAVAVRTTALAGDERPVHHSQVPVVRAGVPAAQHPSDHRGDGHPAGDVLATWCGRSGVDRPDHRHRAVFPAGVHPAVAAGPGPIRPCRNACRGIRSRAAGGEILRPRTVRLRPVR